MSNSRISNSLKNISSGILAQVVQMILGFVSRTIFIQYLAVEYLGINSLFSNIITLLSLAELGLGAAFVYALYKPIAEDNKIEIATVISFYRKTYLIVGICVLALGSALLPFLAHIIPEKPTAIVEDIRFIYLIFVFTTASTYLFSYKISLLDANQQIAVATKYTVLFSIVQNLAQILVLVLTGNFIFYLLTQTLIQFTSNWYISKVVDRRFPFLKDFKHLPIAASTKQGILKNVKATFLTKIGGVIVNGTDNLFISYFVGLAVLGKFSNYVMLLAMVSSFVMIVFSNVKSSIANVIQKETLEKQREIFLVLNFMNFWIFGLCALLFVFTVDDFISIWIGDAYNLPFSIVIILALNFFMVGIQSGFWTFKGSYGFFNEGKYLVLLTALLNLILSYFGGVHYGILGILLATAIARLVTNFWYDPYVVLKKGLKWNPMNYFVQFIKYIFVLLLVFGCVYYLSIYLNYSNLLNLVIKLLLTFVFMNGVIFLFFRKTKEMELTKYYVKLILGRFKLFKKG